MFGHKRERDYLPVHDGSDDGSSNSGMLGSSRRSYKDWVIATLAVAVIVLSALQISTSLQDRIPSPSRRYGVLNASDDRWIQYDWTTDYGHAKDPARTQELWDSILPSHGVVAVDKQWALDQHLPASMSFPSDHNKGVYIIDAYHQIHCLSLMRKTFVQLEQGLPLTFTTAHSKHCFDSIRQYIMCNAGDTLLYTWGKNETGDGQVRQCRNWQTLNDWATEHSACYRDTLEPIPLGEHFGYCDNGSDGLLQL